MKPFLQPRKNFFNRALQDFEVFNSNPIKLFIILMLDWKQKK